MNDNCIGMTDFRTSSMYKTVLYRAFHMHYFLGVCSFCRWWWTSCLLWWCTYSITFTL